MKTKLLVPILACSCFGGVTLPAATNVVQIRNYYFTPTNVTINVGDTVLWTNTAASTTHDTTSTNAAFPWASGDLTGANRTFAVKFTNSGTFFYICNQHFFAINPHHEQTGNVIVASVNLPPSVSLTNPASNARFRAPANILLQAADDDTGGSVTNVQFFSGGSLLSGDSSPPFAFTFSNAAAGNYTFTARAVDNLGTAATSAPINIFVQTNAVLSNAARLADGPFRLTVLGIAGQTYTMEASSNLQSWLSFQTNVAPANSFNVTDFTSTNVLPRFYRARQDL